MNKTTQKFDVYTYVNDVILSQLGKIKDGDTNYLISGSVGLAYNPLSKTLYKGINMVLLYIMAEKKKYTHNAWATFSQIKKAGGTLKKGCKAVQVIFYKFSYFLDGKRISETEARAYAQMYANSKSQLKRLTKKALLRYYNVFHLSQVDGLDHLIKEYKPTDFLAFETLDLAQSILDSSGATITHEAVNVACYIPSLDKIRMPLHKFFVSNNKYYAVALHELSHWTGHKSRLNRKFNGDKKEYAFEELVAEFSAAYLTAFCEIPGELQNSAAYIDSWIAELKNDKTFAFKAISKAKKASEFILDIANVSLKIAS